jgi:hypothetical protein
LHYLADLDCQTTGKGNLILSGADEDHRDQWIR